MSRTTVDIVLPIDIADYLLLTHAMFVIERADMNNLRDSRHPKELFALR